MIVYVAKNIGEITVNLQFYVCACSFFSLVFFRPFQFAVHSNRIITSTEKTFSISEMRIFLLKNTLIKRWKYLPQKKDCPYGVLNSKTRCQLASARVLNAIQGKWRNSERTTRYKKHNLLFTISQCVQTPTPYCNRFGSSWVKRI